VKTSTRPDLWLPPKSAFAGFRFPPEVIVVAVRWYLRYNLSYRDVEELLVERGVEVDHVSTPNSPGPSASTCRSAASPCSTAPRSALSAAHRAA
jgi:hypothetical protein